MSEPTVFIIDDDAACLDSTRELLDSAGLAAETFESASAFLQAFDRNRPGCLVPNVRMPGMNGLAVQDHLIEIGARIPVVFLSGRKDIATAVQTIRNCAVDFVQKPYRDQHLFDSINEALRRDAARRTPRAQGLKALDMQITSLTAREREAMSLALQGLQSKHIARELAISARTIEKHRSRLLNKLGVSSLAELLSDRANLISGGFSVQRASRVLAICVAVPSLPASVPPRRQAF